MRTQAESTVRTIYSLEVLQEGSEIIIRIKGNGFLYNMVRIITGTLIQVGKGKFKPEYVKQMLEAKDRTVAGQTAPPQGLTLLALNMWIMMTQGLSDVDNFLDKTFAKVY